MALKKQYLFDASESFNRELKKARHERGEPESGSGGVFKRPSTWLGTGLALAAITGAFLFTRREQLDSLREQFKSFFNKTA